MLQILPLQVISDLSHSTKNRKLADLSDVTYLGISTKALKNSTPESECLGLRFSRIITQRCDPRFITPFFVFPDTESDRLPLLGSTGKIAMMAKDVYVFQKVRQLGFLPSL